MGVYWAFLDGLRAYAVVVVILFHLEVPGFEGGFVGVDMFFVISGFIVTHVNIPSIVSETFRFKDFYLRRAKRLMPELYLVMFSSLITGTLILPREKSARLAISGLAQTFFGSNIRFWLEAEDYFGAGARSKPLLHTWSLSVEEQYYFLFPVIACFIKSSLGERMKLSVFIVVFSVSLSIYLTFFDKMEYFCFFLLPTRIWEFALGVALAIVQDYYAEKPFLLFSEMAPREKDLLKNVITIGASSSLILSLIYYPAISLFYKPLSLIIPVLSTSAIISVSITVPPSEDERPTIVARCLSTSPIVFIGKLSYSLYLWHWPILCFAQIFFPETGPENVLVFSGILFFTTLLSICSFRYLTTPVRAIPTSTITNSWTTICLALAPLVAFLVSCCALILAQSQIGLGVFRSLMERMSLY